MKLIITTTLGLIVRDKVIAINDNAKQEVYQIDFIDGSLEEMSKKDVLLIQVTQ